MRLAIFSRAVPPFFRRGGVIPWLLFCLSLLLPSLAAAAQSAAPTSAITLAFSDESMVPYFMANPRTGTISGPWQQMLSELFEQRLGWQVNYLLRPWQRAQNEVKAGLADGMITIITTERQDYTVSVPTPFCCFPLHLFTRKDHPQLDKMRQIDSVPGIRELNLQLVSNIGNGWYKNTVEKAGVSTIWLPTDEQMVRFVAAGRGDGFIDLPASIANLSGKLGLQGEIVDTGVSFGQINVHLLFGKTSPFAGRTGEIDAALRACRAEGRCMGSQGGGPNITSATGSGQLCNCGMNH